MLGTFGIKAKEVDFESIRGSDLQHPFVYKYANGTVANLTDFSAVMKLFRKGKPIYEFTAANGGISISGALGKITVIMAGNLTKGLPEGEYDYQIEVAHATLGKRRIQQGKLFFS